MSTFGWYRPWLSDLQASKASSKAKALAAVLAVEERDGVVRETAGTLADRASLGEKTARRALVELETAGWLTHRRSRYCLVVTLTPRTVTTTDLDSENGHHDRSENGHPDPKNGRHDHPERSPRPILSPTGLPDLPIKSPGTADAGDRANAAVERTTSISKEEVDLAEEVRGVLQRGIDGLTTDEPIKAPTRQAVLAALREHQPDPMTARTVAIEVRSIAQSQNRAPNIAALYAQRLRQQLALDQGSLRAVAS